MISIIIIAAILLIILVILLFICKTENTRLLTELQIIKEKHKMLDQETVLLGLILAKLSFMVKINLMPLTKDTMPVKVMELDGSVMSDVTAIRFKKVNDNVLIFVNGAMVPYTGEIKLNHPNSFTNTNFKDINIIIETLHKKQHAGINILANLKQIHQNLNR